MDQIIVCAIGALFIGYAIFSAGELHAIRKIGKMMDKKEREYDEW